MDRRQRFLPALYASVAIIGVLSGCATIALGEVNTPSESSGVATVERDSELPVTEDPVDTVASLAVPEVSLSPPSPSAIHLLAPIHPTDRTLITGEFHFSTVSGWPASPVPRILDDLPLHYAPVSPDAVSQLRLILPSVSGLLAHLRPEDQEQEGAAAPFDGPLEVATMLSVDGDEISEGPIAEVNRIASHAWFPGVAEVSEAAELSSMERIPPVVEAERVRRGTVVLDVGLLRSTESDLGIVPAATPAAGVTGLDSRGDLADRIDGTRDALDRGDDGASVILPAEAWSQRRVTAVPQSDFVITLPGSGWLYVGREYGIGIANLIAKRSVAGDDEFVFQFSESGEYGLWFQHQDIPTGRITNERLQVDASLGGSDRISVVSLSETTTPVPDPIDSGIEPWPALEVSATTFESARVADKVDGSAQWIETALAASQSGNVPVAAEYWQKVNAAGGSDAHLARESLFALAVGGANGVGGGDPAVLGVAVDALRAAGELDNEHLLQIARAADAAGIYGDAAVYYAELSEVSPNAPALDAIYFRLAQILEMPGPARDLRRARVLYVALIDRYPLSRYWDESAARIEYLKRHYFEIR